MAGVVFIVCIPTVEHEAELKERVKKRSRTHSNKTLKISNSLQNGVQQIEDDETTYLLKDCDSNVFNSLRSSSDTSEEDKPSMETITMDILKKENIDNYSWFNKKDGKYIQIMFPMESGPKSEELLETLKENMLGRCQHSIVSVMPCSLYYQGGIYSETHEKLSDCSTSTEIERDHTKTTAWTRFLSSVSARLSVAQVVQGLRTDAALTFDFICLIIIATTLCSIGLVENSNVYLLSSMLISPMMGPVMAGTFGSVIRDKKLQKMGVQNELLGLGIAVLVGFCSGSIICFSTDRYGENDWPTAEMISRGEIRTLGVGCLIALLSGAAVALGILSDNFASLVGVAISTSLMPPAVNAGLLWSMSFVYYVKGNETTRYTTLSYTQYYSTNHAVELTSLGAISLCLTFVNIICIYVAGILVFKIKEVAPIASRDQARRQFWKHDIKIARNYNKTLNNEEAMQFHQQLLASYTNASTELIDELCHSVNIPKHSVVENSRRSQYTWSPCTDKEMIYEVKKMYKQKSREKTREANYMPRSLNYNMPPYVQEQRRLSQLFATNKSLPTKEHHLSSITEASQNSEENKKVVQTRKFLVTPCSSDPLRDTPQ